MRKKNTLKLVFLGIMLLACLQYSFAQYHRVHGNDANGKWHILVEPYFMFPYMNGTVGMGTQLPAPVPPRVEVDVKQTPGDILENLKMLALVSGVMYNKNWSISTDVVYMNLGKSVVHSSGIASGDISLTQFNWEVAGMYRFLPWLEGGLAMQLNSIKAKLNATAQIPSGPFTVNQDRSKVWVDPSLVGRAYYAFTDSKKWFVQCQANIGGFGIGSNFYWQVQPYVGYYFSRIFQMSAGYRLMSQDYRNGRDETRFTYDMLTHGPLIKLGFNIK